MKKEARIKQAVARKESPGVERLRIILWVIILRAVTFFAAWLGLQFFEFKPSFPYADAVLINYGSPLFWSWANFDGVHYLMLSEKGYAFGLTQAFFPLYHLLIRWGSIFLNNKLLIGLLISHLSFLGLLIIFYKLMRLDWNEKTTRKTILALVLFPTAFFFLCLYSESLFLFLVFWSFYLMRKRKWRKAGLIGAFASATRIFGIFLVPAMLYEIYKDKRKSIQHPASSIQFFKYLPAFLPFLGLLSYMVYLYKRFGDPLMFAHVQEGFGGGRTTAKLILLYQVFWRYFKMVFTVDTHNIIYFTVWLELLTAFGFLGLLVWAYYKKIRKSYLIFAVLAYILPTLTGTFSSMPRYALALFPAFILIGSIKNKYLYWGWIFASTVLLIICTMLFTRGYWIA